MTDDTRKPSRSHFVHAFAADALASEKRDRDQVLRRERRTLAATLLANGMTVTAIAAALGITADYTRNLLKGVSG